MFPPEGETVAAAAERWRETIESALSVRA
jgi:hypothetical protein